MASLFTTLSYKWSGSGDTWRLPLNSDDYALLQWEGPNPKPTEAEIRAFSAEVDAVIAQRQLYRRFMNAIQDTDNLLQALEFLTAAVQDLQSRAGVTGQVANRVTAHSGKLTTSRNG